MAATSKRGASAGTVGQLNVGGLESVAATSSIVITCGSGGVGKTTTAAAFGLSVARHEAKRVLVVTIDPARRLADSLGIPEIGAKEVRVPIDGLEGEFSIAMLDTSASWDDLIRRHAPDATTSTKILSNPLYRNITQRFVQSHDYIAMEHLYDLNAEGRFDLVVIDTPPSRHALDFLDAPQRMAEFFSSSLLKWITLPYRTFGEKAGRLGYLAAKPFYQVADRILGSQFLQDIAEFFLLFQGMYAGFVERADAVTALLHDPQTSFIVVSTPEPSPLHEAEFFMRELEQRKLRLGGLVLNQVLPDVFHDPAAQREVAALLSLTERAGKVSPERQLALDVARSFQRFARLADRQADEIRRLAMAPERTVRIPMMNFESDQIGAMTDMGAMLWGEPVIERSAATKRTKPKNAR
jgi:anion-transporting  ArsA/GET3 family ATPase